MFEIPTIIAKIPTKTPFVWFDLICIPQNGSVIASQEIARQAIIFEGAKYAVAWFSDIENFSTLSSVLEWYALELLELSMGSKDNEHRLRRADAVWQTLGDQKCGLFEYSTIPPEPWNCLTNPWFSSLWTLQETAMRPDMWLCSRNWDFVTCPSTSPLSLSGLIAIQSQFRSHRSLTERLLSKVDLRNGLAALEIAQLHKIIGSSMIPFQSQAEILALCDRRECTGKRAEAIMSVLGTTKWYKAATTAPNGTSQPYKENTSELVLGKFPLEMVNEIRQKIPQMFFMSYVHHDSMDEIKNDVFTHENVGTMLPFSKDSKVSNARYFRSHIAANYHESVATWTILESGAVKIPRACILSSPEIARSKINRELPTTINGIRVDKEPEVESNAFMNISPARWIDLHHWCRTRPLKTFAIVVDYSHPSNKYGSSFEGIILGGGPDGSFVKVANFWAVSPGYMDVPPTMEVDWLIL